MRRFPTPWLPLAAVVLTAGIAGGARADTTAATTTAATTTATTDEAPSDGAKDGDTEENTPVVAIANAPSSAAEDPVPAPVLGTPDPAAPTTASPASPVLTPVLAPAGTVA